MILQWLTIRELLVTARTSRTFSSLARIILLGRAKRKEVVICIFMVEPVDHRLASLGELRLPATLFICDPQYPNNKIKGRETQVAAAALATKRVILHHTGQEMLRSLFLDWDPDTAMRSLVQMDLQDSKCSLSGSIVAPEVVAWCLASLKMLAWSSIPGNVIDALSGMVATGRTRLQYLYFADVPSDVAPRVMAALVLGVKEVLIQVSDQQAEAIIRALADRPPGWTTTPRLRYLSLWPSQYVENEDFMAFPIKVLVAGVARLVRFRSWTSTGHHNALAAIPGARLTRKEGYGVRGGFCYTVELPGPWALGPAWPGPGPRPWA